MCYIRSSLVFSASRYSSSPVHCHNDSFNSSISISEEERAITPTHDLEGGNLEVDDVPATKSNIEPKNLLGVGTIFKVYVYTSMFFCHFCCDCCSKQE